MLGVVLGIIIGYVIKYRSFPMEVVGEQIGSLADWFSAVGTIGAVVVALYARYDPERRKIAEILAEMDNLNQQKLSENGSLISCLWELSKQAGKLAEYCYLNDEVDKKQENLIKQQIEDIKGVIQKTTEIEWVPREYKKQSEEVQDIISELLSQSKLTKEDITDIFQRVLNLHESLVEVIQEEQDKLGKSNKEIRKMIRKHHISSKYFLAQKR